MSQLSPCLVMSMKPLMSTDYGGNLNTSMSTVTCRHLLTVKFLTTNCIPNVVLIPFQASHSNPCLVKPLFPSYTKLNIV